MLSGVPRCWRSWRAGALEAAEVKPLVQDRDPGTSEIAANWVARSDGNPLIDIYPRPGDFVGSVTPKITPGIKPATVRFTLDGSEPTPKSRSGNPGPLTATTTLKAALFVGDQKIGNTLAGTYRKRESNLTLPALGTVNTPTTVAQVLPLLLRPTRSAVRDSSRRRAVWRVTAPATKAAPSARTSARSETAMMRTR